MAIPTNKLQYVAFSTQFTYEQVHMRGTVNMTLGGTASVTHNLGYVPYCRVWYVYGANLKFPAASSPYSPYDVEFVPKTNTLDFTAFSGLFGTFGNPVTIHYRIYKQKAI